MEKLNVTVAGKISPVIMNDLQILVEKLKVSKSELIRNLINEYIQKHLQNG